MDYLTKPPAAGQPLVVCEQQQSGGGSGPVAFVDPDAEPLKLHALTFPSLAPL